MIEGLTANQLRRGLMSSAFQFVFFADFALVVRRGIRRGLGARFRVSFSGRSKSASTSFSKGIEAARA